jgi:hypothetical protein
MGAPGSRPGSAFGFASRLTPIGQPLENSGSSIGQSFETLSVIGESLDSVEVRPHTMPNLGSALDRRVFLLFCTLNCFVNVYFYPLFWYNF